MVRKRGKQSRSAKSIITTTTTNPAASTFAPAAAAAAAVVEKNDEEKKKVVYMLRWNPVGPLYIPDGDLWNWYRFDPHFGDKSPPAGCDVQQGIACIPRPKMTYSTAKDLLSVVDFYSIAACDSMICLVGGVNVDTHRFSEHVLFYDTETDSWDCKDSKLIVGRLYPAVVITRGVIYVFGGLRRSHDPIYRKNWAEYCVVKDKDSTWDWKPLPSLPEDPSFDFFNDAFVHHALLHKNGHQILLWVTSIKLCVPKIFSYDYHTRRWTRFDTSTDQFNYCYRYRMVIGGDILYWHESNTIYGYHLIKKVTVMCHNLSSNPDLFDRPYAYPDTGFLFHVGNETLFLMQLDPATNGTAHCYKFQIVSNGGGGGGGEGGSSSTSQHLEVLGRAFFPLPGRLLRQVVILSDYTNMQKIIGG